MQHVSFCCPHCTGTFQVGENMAGQQVGCPHCQGAVSIPGGLAVIDPVAPSAPVPSAPVPVPPVSVTTPDSTDFRYPPGMSPTAKPASTLPPTSTPDAGRNPLPPTAPRGESAIAPAKTPAETSSKKSAKIDSLLPPEAGDHSEVNSAKPIPLPSLPARPVAAKEIDGERFSAIAIDDSFRVSDPLDEDDVDGRTSEQRAKARLVKNVLLFLAGLAILLVTLWLLSDAKPVIET